MIRLLPILTAAIVTISPVYAAEPETEAELAAQADYQAQVMLQEAERARAEAESARREAEKVAERAREMSRARAEREARDEQIEMSERQELARQKALQEEEMQRAREELSRAHRELREASREVARAHRELSESDSIVRTIRLTSLGDRAVIGVVLGSDVEQGIELVGVSPGGPAEEAGILAGDVMVSIAGESLAGEEVESRARVYEIMETVEAGEDLQIVVERDGQAQEFTVTAEVREPSSWQSLVRIPETLGEAETVGSAPRIRTIERIAVPEIDEEALHERLEEAQKRLETSRFIYHTPQGSHEIEHSWEFNIEDFSEIGGHAFGEANIWFGLPLTMGLEFATLNEGLGKYFDTDRGVLVIEARDDNAYELKPGDVIMKVTDTEVSSPAELMRALREVEPGEEVELKIKRNRKNKTIKVVMPENRLGLR